MRRRPSRWAYRGCDVVGPTGDAVGTVAEVWPDGGEPEMVLVHVGARFRRWRYLPLDGRPALEDGVLRVPWSRTEIDEAPDAEDRRWGDPAHVAQAFWRDSDD